MTDVSFTISLSLQEIVFPVNPFHTSFVRYMTIARCSKQIFTQHVAVDFLQYIPDTTVSGAQATELYSISYDPLKNCHTFDWCSFCR